MKRRDILYTAEKLVNGAREDTYGAPQESFQRIADMWTAAFGRKFTASEVTLALALVKIGRLHYTPNHEDSWVDAAGYLALGGELATERTEK